MRNPFKNCPVTNGIMKDNFGVDRDGHPHQGIDILAEYGEPILATFDGVVTNPPGDSGGYEVKLTRSDGAFIVGKHLSETVDEGRVSAGDVIGYVGKLDADRAKPHLHFEWHPRGRKPKDPFPYLKDLGCKVRSQDE